MFQYWNKLYMGVTLRWKGARQKFWVFFKSDFHENAISEGFRSIPESLRTQIQHLFFEKRKISTISKLLFEILGNKTQMSELCHEFINSTGHRGYSTLVGMFSRTEPTHPRRLSWVRKIKNPIELMFFFKTSEMKNRSSMVSNLS